MSRLFFAVTLLLFGPVSHAHAFGTINSLGQSAEHEKITRLALRPFRLGRKTLAEIAGRRGRYGAVGAPDLPGRGLLTKAAAHCDGGDHLALPGYPQSRNAATAKLRACRRWIFSHLTKAVVEAGGLVDASGRIQSSQIPTRISCSYSGVRGRAKCNVLEALGLAFHAAQDFYSHTNWTDIPPRGKIDPKMPPGIGQNSRAAWLDPRSNEAVPAGLISGCFEGIPEKQFCKNRVRHADLNKDTGLIDVGSGFVGAGSTSRGQVNNNFSRAVHAAITDTRDKWAYFETQVLTKYGRLRGSKIICVIRRDYPAGC